MNYAFSKILILVVLIILATGGILAWQYFGEPKEEIELPEEKTEEVAPEETGEIKVISPNGGERWTEGNKYDITWRSSKIEKVNIEITYGRLAHFSTGEVLGQIATGIDAKLGKYTWEIPTGFVVNLGITGLDMMRIGIYDPEKSSLYDESDDYFTIVEEDEISKWKSYWKTYVGEDETSEWETYRNEGISVKYPPDFEPIGEGQIDFVRFIEGYAKESLVTKTLYSLLVFTPATDSLENYLELYADKLGKEILNKEIEAFGEAREGIIYNIEISSRKDDREIGYIFNSGLFTYHFWREGTAPEPVELFFKTLSTLKLHTPLTKISVQEADGQRIYRNENYGIEFRYPREWGSLALQSIKQDNNGSKIYRFDTSGELISKIYYHKPSNLIALITKGGKYDLVSGGSSRQDILQVYKDGKAKTLYTISPKGVQWYENIYNVDFSPDGKYIYFDISGWEWSSNKLLNTDNGLNVIENYDVLFSSYRDVYWSQNNKVLAIRGYRDDMGGEGTDGLFVSDYGKLEKLNQVLTFSWAEHFGGSDIYDIRFVNDDKLSFSVKFKLTGEEAYEKKYEYIVKTKELKEIE